MKEPSPLRPASATIRVIVVAELRLYREGLAQLLDQDPRLSVVGVAASVDEAVGHTSETRPDVAILDLRGSRGRAAVRALGRATPAPRVVAIAVRETDSDIVAWAEAGIAGYVTREESLQQLVAAVTSAAQGELHCSPRVAAALLRRVAAASGGEDSLPLARLTRRETEIAQLLDVGLSNKEIAAHLRIERATVKNHVHNILQKLRARTRAQAAARLRREGLLPVALGE